MVSPTFPSLFQLSNCLPEPHAHLDPRKVFCSGFLSLGDQKRDGRETAPIGIRWGVGLGETEGDRYISVHMERERLTWRRLRGEGSALQELHCEHKAKAEGEGRDQAAARTGFPRPPPKKKTKKKTPKPTPTIFWIKYLAILGHTMRFIFKSAFCFMLSVQDSVSTLRGDTCVRVCMCRARVLAE